MHGFCARSLLRPSYRHLVLSWSHLGAILGPSWAVLGPSWGHPAASLESQNLQKPRVFRCCLYMFALKPGPSTLKVYQNHRKHTNVRFPSALGSQTGPDGFLKAKVAPELASKGLSLAHWGLKLAPRWLPEGQSSSQACLKRAFGEQRWPHMPPKRASSGAPHFKNAPKPQQHSHFRFPGALGPQAGPKIVSRRPR